MRLLPFGAALLAAALTPALAASLPTTKPGSTAVLLGVDTVRKELRLTSLQRAVLTDIRAEYREEARALVAKTGSSPAARQQSQAQLDALTATYNRRALRALNDDQRIALVRIEHQFLGAFMLLDAGVQRGLALTPRQKSKLADVWAFSQRKVSAINREYEQGHISAPERIRELRDNRIDRSDDLLERLTVEQRAKLDQLAGRKLT